jgi:hypothetical protein
LHDYRRKQGKRHSLEVVIMIIIMAIMSGAKGERAVARFAENNKNDLIKALKIKRKEVPTRCVFKGIIKNIDFNQLQNIFYQWALKIVEIKEKDIISIDGKAIRGTIEKSNNKFSNFVSLVSVFASKRKQVLTTTKIETRKENELPKVQELIMMLNLKDATFTLDALHCQEKTTKIIKKTENHYIIGVKDNQKKLNLDIKKL